MAFFFSFILPQNCFIFEFPRAYSVVFCGTKEILFYRHNNGMLKFCWNILFPVCVRICVRICHGGVSRRSPSKNAVDDRNDNDVDDIVYDNDIVDV